jgi:hypothetical protein
MLSESERRRLDELELELATDDPGFADRFHPDFEHRGGTRRFAIGGFLAVLGVALTIVALTGTIVPLAVFGLCLVGAGACAIVGTGTSPSLRHKR